MPSYGKRLGTASFFEPFYFPSRAEPMSYSVLSERHDGTEKQHGSARHAIYI